MGLTINSSNKLKKRMKPSLILAIESSCDDTSVSVVKMSAHPHERILALKTSSQLHVHLPYGGVIPEFAARAHLSHLEELIQETLNESGLTLKDMDAFAATCGPGLIGGVLVGSTCAKALSYACQKPFIAINHLEGHALTPRLTHNVAYPFVLLLVSGGHCQFLQVKDLGQYTLLGETLDDAVGEAFDKVAKMLGLSYPGGPLIEKMAQKGNPYAIDFPRPLKGKKDCMMSFSGLKTAVKSYVDEHAPLSQDQKNDVAASFQQAVSETLVEKSLNALEMLETPYTDFVLAGGVAANQNFFQKVIRLRLPL
jgi:N6-L-threonylcarbamoyladenine synthase